MGGRQGRSPQVQACFHARDGRRAASAQGCPHRYVALYFCGGRMGMAAERVRFACCIPHLSNWGTPPTLTGWFCPIFPAVFLLPMMLLICPRRCRRQLRCISTAPSDLAALRQRPEFTYDGVWMLFDIDTSRLSTRARRFNATLPENLLAAIDSHVAEYGGSRSGFLAEAARDKLASFGKH